MMAYRAIIVGILLAGLLAALMLLLTWLWQPTVTTSPQVLVLFAAWTLPGYVAAGRAGEAGILHGMLTGLFGMLLISLAFQGLTRVGLLSFAPLEVGSHFICVILAGFWASVGGMIADNVRLIKAKRAARRGRASTDNRK
jgi:hypothetical protein